MSALSCSAGCHPFQTLNENPQRWSAGTPVTSRSWPYQRRIKMCSLQRKGRTMKMVRTSWCTSSFLDPNCLCAAPLNPHSPSHTSATYRHPIPSINEGSCGCHQQCDAHIACHATSLCLSCIMVGNMVGPLPVFSKADWM